MARSKGKRALLAAACLGLGGVWGSTTLAQSPPAAVASAQRTVTVGVAGKKHTCRVIQQWAVPGGQAYHVQSLDTMEMLTLVRTTPSTPGMAESPVRIYRWTDGSTPPRGAPMPPGMS